ncbi:MAG: hypothetical protein O3A10_11490 [Chloroflexi bacterium]|nr:hypothetical protein [Chloroflexota bacterium]MDA1147141.1 hypothetical protein [Chloroflexota bacterium]
MSAKLDVQRQFEEYDAHPGDRERMFRAVADRWPARARVLYLGSYIDASPSFVFPDVTYVDVDRRAARFFVDQDGVDALIRERRGDRTEAVSSWRFFQANYAEPLEVADGSIDLLVSL